MAALNERDPTREKGRSVEVSSKPTVSPACGGRSAYPRRAFNITDLYDALTTARVIGDDYLQQAAGNVVDTSLFTHGSSEQRQSWLKTGYKSGRPGSCDTFIAR